MTDQHRIRPLWLASYPRSGNTFLRIILENLFGLASYSLYHVEGESHPDPSAEPLEKALRLPRNWRERLTSDTTAPFVPIKTHGTPEDDSPAIYLIRDGRAAIDSYYHYHKTFAFEQPSLTDIIAGACQFGDWSSHYRAWQPLDRPRTLFLRYADLVADPAPAVAALAELLGRPPNAGGLPSFQDLKARFPAFFRRGKNTDFLKEWSPGQLALFEALHGDTMWELGFKLAPAGSVNTAVVTELAQSVSRSHQLYLDELRKTAAASVYNQNLSQELERLTAEVEQLSAKLARKQQVLTPLLSSRWVRVGMKLHALERFSDNGANHLAGV